MNYSNPFFTFKMRTRVSPRLTNE